jgi:hypothetical protein
MEPARRLVWLPDLAATLTVATMVYCLFLYGAGQKFFRDSDAGWHIRNGERIIEGRTLPGSDPFSFSKSGQPWFSWEWGSDVVMGLAYRLDGLRGVTALVAAAIAGSVWMWTRLNFAAGGSFLMTGLLAPLMVSTTSLHWLARPHVFSWLFLLGALLYAERAPRRFGMRQAAIIGGVTAVWANLHGSFLLAPAIALAYALSHVLRPIFWPIERKNEAGKARWFFSAALASLGGSLLNPYGWQLHAHILSYLFNDRLTSRIAEFQSFNFHEKDATQMALTMALAAAGAIFALTQKNLAHFLISAMFLWGGLRSARVLPLVALLILPFANAAFTTALREASGLRPRIRRAIDAALRYSANLRVIDRRAGGMAFSAIAMLGFLLLLRAPAFSKDIGFPADQFPVAASMAVEKLPAEARIFAPDSYGGYLIYRFHGARKVYCDGRSDFYGADFLRDYLVLLDLRPGWRDILRSGRFTHALLPAASALQTVLEQDGWRPLYRDGVATLLEAR